MNHYSEHGESESAVKLPDNSDNGKPANTSEVFPVTAFPKSIQEIISALQTGLNFPPEFSAAGILFAASVAIGNRLSVRIKNDWILTPILYLALIGRPGTNKTHPPEWTLRPLRKSDALAYQQYKEAQAIYEQSLKAKEEFDKPALRKSLVSDATPEALAAILVNNPNGIGLFMDELLALVMNFGRYSKGSDQELFLSAFSGISITIDRKTTGPIYIPKPFISVCGGLQPSVLGKLAADGRSENGFLDRFLFFFPEGLEKPFFSRTELDAECGQVWETIIDRLIHSETEHRVIELSDQAKVFFEDWFNKNTRLINIGPDEESCIRAKFDTHIPRLALILEALKGQRDEPFFEISGQSMMGAIRLGQYLMHSAFRVRAQISGSPIDRLPQQKAQLYKALPDTFETATALAHGDGIGFSRATMFHFLSERSLFRKEAHGWYTKLFPE